MPISNRLKCNSTNLCFLRMFCPMNLMNFILVLKLVSAKYFPTMRNYRREKQRKITQNRHFG